MAGWHRDSQSCTDGASGAVMALQSIDVGDIFAEAVDGVRATASPAGRAPDPPEPRVYASASGWVNLHPGLGLSSRSTRRQCGVLPTTASVDRYPKLWRPPCCLSAGSDLERVPVLCCGSAAHVERLVFDRVEEFDPECAALDAQLGVFSGGPEALCEGLVGADVDDA